MTNQLQLFDVSINKPFKHLVHKHYNAWLNKDNCKHSSHKEWSVSHNFSYMNNATPDISVSGVGSIHDVTSEQVLSS
jgi:hypothetical protein